MDGLEDRVRVLEKQVRRYRLLNLALAVVALAWFGFVMWAMWPLMHLQQIINPVEPILRTKRLEIIDEPASRPVCVLRAEEGGGRVEVMDRLGRPIAGFDGNTGMVVRSADGPRFPETRPPR
jgi:hypothetical protein